MFGILKRDPETLIAQGNKISLISHGYRQQIQISESTKAKAKSNNVYKTSSFVKQ